MQKRLFSLLSWFLKISSILWSIIYYVMPQIGGISFGLISKIVVFLFGRNFFRCQIRLKTIDAKNLSKVYVTLEYKFPPSLWVAVSALNCKQMNNGPESFHSCTCLFLRLSKETNFLFCMALISISIHINKDLFEENCFP